MLYLFHDLASRNRHRYSDSLHNLGPTLHIESNHSGQSLHADALKNPDSPIHQHQNEYCEDCDP